MTAYNTLPPSAKVKPIPFTVSTSEDKLQQFQQLLKLSPIGIDTYENQQEDLRFGLTRQWMNDAKAQWENDFDWRAHEKYINSFPHYTLPVKDPFDGRTFTIHFIALFSATADATPIVFYHGWPGSFLEFLPLLSLLQKKYPDPATLPYHIVVPSLPGFAFSSKPPLDKDWTGQDTARILNQLMVDLGLSGYIAQGGDVGSFISRMQAVAYDECRSALLNFNVIPQKPPGVPDDALDELETRQLARAAEFMRTGTAYAVEHGTRPATIGLALASSPVALLAWIAEKFLTWADKAPSMDTILESVTLYWLTDTFPTSIYTYRQAYNQSGPKMAHADPSMYITKPFGYAYFAWDVLPAPRAWVATTGNLVWHSQHAEGGHFAALERPELLLQDVEDFVKELRKVHTG